MKRPILLSREHLTGEYNWDTGHEMYTGQASRRLFDRSDGNQVLYMINLYGTLDQSFTIEKGLVIEDLIVNKLPMGKQSEVFVFKWLEEYYAFVDHG